MTWHLLTTDFPPLDGGIATWTAGVAGALHDAGEPVEVHVRGRPEGRWGGVWAAISARRHLAAGDRILAATWPLATHLVGAAPLLVAYHGSDLTRPPRVTGLERVRSAAINLPVSRFLGERLGAPFTVVPSPIDPLPPVRRGDRLLVIARLGPLKGVDRAIRLARRLDRPITVVGDGPERAALERLAGELGVDAVFTGRLAREAIPWDGAWALALLSRPDPAGGGEEGLGLVCLEAAARGIPSIGAPTGGIPEAASVILEDPDEGVPGPLPTGEAVRAWLAEHHGRARVVAALRVAAMSSPALALPGSDAIK
jgi:glycosyltransferase involved in cell wall biosynthesis